MSATELPPLTPGDFIPPFTLPDQDGTMREIQLYAGRVTVLSFLPASDETFLSSYLQAVATRENEISAGDFFLLSIVDAGRERIAEIRTRYNTSRLGLTQSYWSDEQQKLRKIFAISQTGGTAIILSRNQRIITRIEAEDGASLLAQIIERVKQIKKPERLVVSEQNMHAPVILIPEAISEQLCADLLEFWKTSEKYQGSIGAGGTEKVNLSGKRRVDANITDRQMLARIDQEICKRVLPELRKVACVEIAYRERYKIGAYSSADKGFYNQHRDTAKHLDFRRYSMSLCLGGDYEGGLLQFPEYDNCAYRLHARCAAIFPSTLLHGVTPVTAGERFVMVSFFYTEAEARIRRLRGAQNIDEMKLLCQPRYEGLDISPHFYTSSLKAW